VRDQLLANVWAEIRAFDAENERNFPAAARAIDSGAAPEDLARAMTAAAYEAVFQTLYLLTGEEDVGTSGSVVWVKGQGSSDRGATPRSALDPTAPKPDTDLATWTGTWQRWQ
jgi:hypothetical protein